MMEMENDMCTRQIQTEEKRGRSRKGEGTK